MKRVLTTGKRDDYDDYSETNDDNGCGPPPVYDPLDKATDVFDNIYFFGNEEYLKLFRKYKGETLQDMTVHEVYFKYTVESGKGERGLLSLVCELRALYDPVMKYYAAAHVGVEERLASLKTIDLSGTREVEIFQNGFPQDNPTSIHIWTTTTTSTKRHSNSNNNNNEENRILPLALVLGPSGSGKTFFALQYLSRKLLVEKAMETKRVTIYLQAMDACVEFNEVTDTTAATALIAWIKNRIKANTRMDIPENKPLEMHVCLIIDEAGVAQVKGWFENKAMLTALCTAAKNIATSVAVIVLGTGLTGHSLRSADDAYVFRMKSWQADDVAMILNNYKTALDLDQGKETPQTLAEAIFAHPKLGALATNARAAYFLVKALARYCPCYSRFSWSSQLDEWTKPLVMQVVVNYMTSNSISRLTSEERRHVAASIFYALRQLQTNKTDMPKLIEINHGENSVAQSLLQLNCELVDHELQLVDGERYAFTVTPAIATVLYTMAGVPATLTPVWKAEQELAALYAVQEWFIHCMERHVAKGIHDPESKLKLSESLAQVCAHALSIPGTSSGTNNNNKDKIMIPMVGPGTILRNVDNVPFADVIAPYMLIQTNKREPSPQGTTIINLHDEMEKCCLLKSSPRDTRVLQGLLELWRGKLNPTHMAHRNKQKTLPQPERSKHQDPQTSESFPANLICFVPPSDLASYAVIEDNDLVLGMSLEKRRLPPLDGTTPITYMVSTNVDRIILYLSSTDKSGIVITPETLDRNLEITVKTLDRSDQVAWRNFVKNHVREGIVMKFLFTKSA